MSLLSGHLRHKNYQIRRVALCVHSLDIVGAGFNMIEMGLTRTCIESEAPDLNGPRVSGFRIDKIHDPRRAAFGYSNETRAECRSQPITCGDKEMTQIIQYVLTHGALLLFSLILLEAIRPVRLHS